MTATKEKKEQYIIKVSPKLTEECSFVDDYELLGHYYYRNNAPPIERVLISGKDKKTKICALCSRNDNEVSFSKEAHIIPAALGNNKYFSNEECNECNEKYGETLENELAQMFGLQRSISGIKGRSLPKIKFHTGETIGFNQSKNSAEVISKENGKIDIQRGDGEVKIFVEMPKYKPYYAILSILKSAWLFLDDTKRKKYPHILELIHGKANDKKLHFFNMFYPGNGTRATSLYIYELKRESSVLPPLVLQFNFLNRVTFWHYPVSDKANNEVFPEVNFPFHEKTAEVKMNGYTISEPNTEWGGKENLTLKYDRIEEFDPNNGIPQSVQTTASISEELKKEVVIKVDDIIINAFLTVVRFDHEAHEFIFEGNELGGRLWFFENKIFRKQETKFFMNLNKVIISNAIKTVDFIEKMSLGTHKIEFLIEQKVFFVATSAHFNMEIDFESLRKGIDYLDTINNEFKLSLRYPAKLIQSDFSQIKHLACAIKYGSFSESSDYKDLIEINCPPDFMKAMEESPLEEASLTFHATKTFKFLGKEFGPFDFDFILENPKIESKVEVNKNEIKYSFLAKNLIQSYPHWIKNDDQ